jgi:peptidoglycan/xylan/chitin deacetylase (PgdA/CDA1 family)
MGQPSQRTAPCHRGVTRVGILRTILEVMRAADLPPVYGFVNGVRIMEEPASVEALVAWQKAGLPIGNHTWSHMNLNERSAKDWEADFLRDEDTLARYAGGRSTRWVRFPYLAEGDIEAKRSKIRSFPCRAPYSQRRANPRSST